MNYQDKSREELISELQNQKLENDTLKVLYNKEIKYRNQIESVLNERLKELNCHNQLSEVMSNPHLSTDEVCKKTLDILPSSWQFPGASAHAAAQSVPASEYGRHFRQTTMPCRNPPSNRNKAAPRFRQKPATLR